MYKKLYHKFSSVDLTVAGEPGRKAVVWADNVTEIPRKSDSAEKESLDNLDFDRDRVGNEKIPLHPVPDYLPSEPVQYVSPSAMKSQESRDQEKAVPPQPPASDWASHWACEQKLSSTPSVQTLDTKPAFSWKNIPILKRMMPQKPDKKRGDVYNVSADKGKVEAKSPKTRSWLDKWKWSPVVEHRHAVHSEASAAGIEESEVVVQNTNFSAGHRFSKGASESPTKLSQLDKWRWTPVEERNDLAGEPRHSYALEIASPESPRKSDENKDFNAGRRFSKKASEVASPKKSSSKSPQQQPSQLDKWRWSPVDRDEDFEPIVRYHDTSEINFRAEASESEPPRSPRTTQCWLDRWRWTPADEGQRSSTYDVSAVVTRAEDCSGSPEDSTSESNKGPAVEDQKKKEPFM